MALSSDQYSNAGATQRHEADPRDWHQQTGTCLTGRPRRWSRDSSQDSAMHSYILFNFNKIIQNAMPIMWNNLSITNWVRLYQA